MTEQKKRGRPATGIKRNIKMTINVTEQERIQIKQQAEKEKMTVADWIISKIK